jgi:hypothetical protein
MTKKNIVKIDGGTWFPSKDAARASMHITLEQTEQVRSLKDGETVSLSIRCGGRRRLLKAAIVQEGILFCDCGACDPEAVTLAVFKQSFPREFEWEILDSQMADRPQDGGSWFELGHDGLPWHGEVVSLNLRTEWERVEVLGRVHRDEGMWMVETIAKDPSLDTFLGMDECPGA